MDKERPMGTTDRKTQASESRLTSLLIQRRIITEGQLKAALDYQKSLGGQIVDILVKLDLVRASQIDEILQKVEGGNETTVSTRADNVLDPASVSAADLKVHRRLLDKLPRELVEHHLLLVFFPAANVVGTRRIILGHGTDITPAIEEKVRSIIGVDLSTLKLDPVAARTLLTALHIEEPPRKIPVPAREKFARSVRPPGAGDDVVLSALLNVLAKRGLVTPEELQVEVDLLGESVSSRVPS
jgi:hypothetical protein